MAPENQRSGACGSEDERLASLAESLAASPPSSFESDAQERCRTSGPVARDSSTRVSDHDTPPPGSNAASRQCSV